MKENILIKTVNTNGIYSCEGLDITVEEWKKVLQDSSISNKQKLWLARFYQEPEHKASCKFMGEKFSCDKNSPNATIKNFGQSTQKILNRFEVQGTDGEKTYWVIPMKQGRYVNGNFEWTMRDELVQAMEELDMTDPEKFENHIFQEIYDNSLISREEDYKSGWANKYNEIIRIVKENVDNNIWTDECKYLVLKSSNNGISGINWGLSNDEYDKILNNWEEFESVFNNIARAKIISKEEYNKIIGMIKNLTGKNYELIVNRVIGALLPGVVSTFPKAEIFYEHLTFVKEKFPELPEITNDWLTDNLNFFKFCKAKVKFQDENHISGFLGVLSKYCKDKTSQGETQMENPQDKLISETKNLLENTKNLILTGAPGTGKTFMAKTVAARIILEREINDFDKDLTEEEKKQVESQTDFVQFHPSYDYTDFVEGLRPKQVDGSDQIGFERKDGVFKAFCEKALLSQTINNKDFLENLNKNPKIWKVSLCRTGENEIRKDCLENNYIRIGWSEYGNIENFDDFENFSNGGKSILRSYQNEMQIGDIVLSCFSAKEIDAIGIITGDYEYKREGNEYPRYRNVKWIVKNIRENITELNNGKSLTLSTIYKLSISLIDIKFIIEKYITGKSEEKKTTPFVFIIDEINRGEVAKIFGELFYCIDPGYRGEKGLISTQYQNLVTSGEFQKGFFIPENVYIIGTMNDIDRSVESMDFAFRRRFSWIEVKASDTVDMLDPKHDDNGELISGLEKDLAEKAKRRMKNLNAEISKIDELNEAYHIGASYFLKLKNYGGDFGKLWDYHIKGILTEYLRGNQNAQEELDKLKAAYDKAEELKVGE